MDLLNPAGGGGLSNAKLALANALPADVLSGKKFYAEDKTLKTGTLALDSIVSTGIPKIFVANDSFDVPITGKYKVTCIGKGGNGGNGAYSSYKVAGGGGGASGGVAQSVVTLTAGQKIAVTVDAALSSFGSMLSATAGENGGSNVYNIKASVGGKGTGGNLYNMDGNGGGVSSVSEYYHANKFGGNAGAYTQDQANKIPYLSTAVPSGGYGNTGGVCSTVTKLGTYPFGVGGGGGGTACEWVSGSADYTHSCRSGGTGNSGAVIVEFLME